jgi:amino acid transporter
MIQAFRSVSGLFYGITLGLIAVGAYETFTRAESAISTEAATLNRLYREINMLSLDGPKAELRRVVRGYTAYVSGEGWQLQKQGIVAKGTTPIVDELERLLSAYPAYAPKDAILFMQNLAENSELGKARRERVHFVRSGLPGVVWQVLLIGAGIITFLTWLLVIGNKKLDILINALCGARLGTLIFLIAAMDYPFHGEFCVKPTPYELLLDGVMKR